MAANRTIRVAWEGVVDIDAKDFWPYHEAMQKASSYHSYQLNTALLQAQHERIQQLLKDEEELNEYIQRRSL